MSKLAANDHSMAGTARGIINQVFDMLERETALEGLVVEREQGKKKLI